MLNLSTKLSQDNFSRTLFLPKFIKIHVDGRKKITKYRVDNSSIQVRLRFFFLLQYHSFSCRLQFFLFIYSVLNWFKWPIRPFQVHFYQRLSQLPWPEAFEFDSSAVPFRLSSQIQSTVRRIPESHITKTLSIQLNSVIFITVITNSFITNKMLLNFWSQMTSYYIIFHGYSVRANHGYNDRSLLSGPREFIIAEFDCIWRQK